MISASGVLLKTVSQFGLEPADLGLQLGDHRDQRSDGGAHRVSDQRRRRQLRSTQRRLDLDGSLFDAALPAATTQRRRDLRSRQLARRRRCRGDRQHGQAVTSGQVIERLEGGRVELAQRGAQLVGLALPGPDHRLMSPSEHLDRVGQFAVTSHCSMVVGVGAGQIGQHLRVTRIGLRPGRRVAFPITRRRHRVDRQHRVPGSDQRPDEQPAIGLRRHQHIGRLLDVAGDQLVEPGHTPTPSGSRPPPSRRPAPSSMNTS